jgi:hypothetical protein
LNRLQTTSRAITAPVAFPSSADLTVKLVPSTFLERLEEYRSEESKWLSALCIFVGAILAVFINITTGGTMGAQTWFILLILSIVALFAGWSARSYGKRASVLKEQLLGKNDTEIQSGETDI